MALQSVNKRFLPGARGLHTEGNPIRGEEQTTIEERNFFLHKDGSRSRRRPIRPMSAAWLHQSRTANQKEGHGMYEWEGSQYGTVRVTQVADTVRLTFEDGTYEDLNFRYIGENLERSDTAVVSAMSSQKISWTHSTDVLYGAHQAIGPFKVWNNGDKWLISTIATFIRDFHGLPSLRPKWRRYDIAVDGTDPVFKLGHSVHLYNLLNQGWTYENVNAYMSQAAAGDWPGYENLLLHMEENDVDPQTIEWIESDYNTYGLTIMPAEKDIWHYGRYVDTSNNRETVKWEVDTYIPLTDDSPQLIIFDNREAIGNTFKAEPAVGSLIHSTEALHRAGKTDSAQIIDPESISCRFASNGTLIVIDGQLVMDGYDGQDSGYVLLDELTYTLTTPAGEERQYSYSGVAPCRLDPVGGTIWYIDIPAPDTVLGTTYDGTVHVISISAVATEPTSFHTEHIDRYVTDGTEGKNNVVGFWQGRLWRAGDGTGRLYYSQVIDDRGARGNALQPTTESRCYGQNDPTDPEVNQTLATDGGYLMAAEIGVVYGFYDMGSYLLVASSNGFWALTADGGMFVGDNLARTKLTKEEAHGKDAILQKDGSIIFVGSDGVYQIANTETGPQVQSLTEDRIDSIIDDLRDCYPEDTRIASAEDGFIRIVYRKPESVEGVSEGYMGSHVILDYRPSLQAWTMHTTTAPYFQILDIIGIEPDHEGARGSDFLYMVAAVVPEVYGFSLPHLICGDALPDALDEATVVVGGWEDYWDVQGLSGPVEGAHVEADCYMTTNPLTLGDGAMEQYTGHVIVNQERVEQNTEDGVFDREGSLWLQALWDWTDHANSGKEGKEQETYRRRRPSLIAAEGAVTDGEPLITTKLRVPGRGRALSLRFSVQEGKYAHLYSYFLTGKVMTTL